MLASAPGVVTHAHAGREVARHLHEDALARNRQILGDNHPQTLLCTEELADDMRAAGDIQTARKLDEKTLADCRKIFGNDHPRTRKITRRLNGEKVASGTAELDKGNV
jgi:hypothetical protein